MPQINISDNQVQAALADLLNIITSSSSPTGCISSILDIAEKMTAARGAYFLLFDEPDFLIVSRMEEKDIPEEDILKEFVSTLSDGINLNPPLPSDIKPQYPGWLAAPIRIQDRDVGIIWIMMGAEPVLSDDDYRSLKIIVDGLTLSSMNIRSEARHKRLGRNQSEFVRVVSHDLRSPLSAMKGFASMLESEMIGTLNEQQAHFVEKILSGIEQMTALVDNIQDAGRYDPETGFYELQRMQCDLAQMVKDIVDNHLIPAEKQELTISAITDDNVPIVNVDSTMLERAIINLVDNAIKYSPNGRDIEVHLYRNNDQVILKVKDSGLGISPENQKRLFERHVRIPRQEHKRIKGSGLGLFIVRSVALRHGGKAWVESKEGEGSSFFISIPLNEESLIVGSARV